MSNIEEEFSRNQAIALIVLLRALHSAYHKHLKRDRWLTRSMMKFNVSKDDCDAFISQLPDPKMLTLYFDSYSHSQKEFTMVSAWGLLTVPGKPLEEEVRITVDAFENIVKISPTQFRNTVEKIQVMTDLANQQIVKMAVRREQKGNIKGLYSVIAGFGTLGTIGAVVNGSAGGAFIGLLFTVVFGYLAVKK